MNKIKTITLILAAMLIGGAISAVAAQEPSLSGTYKATVEASEISEGQLSLSTGETFGWTWNSRTQGDLNGFMFVSVNYSAPLLAGEVGVPTNNDVIGGSWSQVFFDKNGVYLGSVSGKIVGGQLTWSQKQQHTVVSLLLTSEQGTDSFAGAVGTGTFEGVFDKTGSAPSMTGMLTLNY
jgi:hypothetical protein